MKDSYEISLWRDEWKNDHYEEIKLAIIGSDKLTTSLRAVEPKLISSTNGTNKFSFKMYMKCDKTENVAALIT